MIRKKIPVTRQRIDPETFLLVSQRLNRYATVTDVEEKKSLIIVKNVRKMKGGCVKIEEFINITVIVICG